MINVSRKGIGSKVRIVGSDFLLTGLTPGQAELQSRDSIAVTKELFLLDIPRESCGREKTPASLRRETRRTIITQCEGQEIPGVERIVQTAIERNEVMLSLPPRITFQLILSRIELDFVRLVELADIAVLAMKCCQE